MRNEQIRRNLADIRAYIDFPVCSTDTGKLCDIHYHDEIELLLLVAGKLRCYIDDGWVDVSVGETLFVDSHIPHWTETTPEGCSYILLQFDPNDFHFANRQGRGALRYLRNIARSPHQSVKIISNHHIAEILQEIWKEYTDKKNGADKMILSHLYYLIGWLERSGYLSEELAVDEQAVQKLAPVFEYIDQNFGKQELSLETASNLMGLNSAYFCRTFKQATGHGFTEYLNLVRIAKSEPLLRDTSLSILDISLEVGFSSVSYFNRVFKKIKNCTPSTYRSAKYSAL